MTKMVPDSSDIRTHFIFKGRAMRRHPELPPHIARQRDKARRDAMRTLKKALARTRPSRALDVGTGFGTSVELLARRFHDSTKIWSVDSSSEVLRQVRRELKQKRLSKGIILKRARAEALPFASGRFDVVVSLLSLHHFSQPAKALAEMVRVLSPKGILLVVDWRPVKSRVIPHSARHVPAPEFVMRTLNRLKCATTLRSGRHWYFVEGKKQVAH